MLTVSMDNLSEHIVYEDEHIVAINKPAGLIVHSDGRTQEPSVSDWFVNKYPEARDVGEPLGEIQRPGVVHRIDRETSGLLLLAKTAEGHKCLKEQFKNREIEKIYHAFVYGNVKQDRGEINLPIGRSASNFKKWSAQRGARGEKREATTHYQVLKRLDDKSATLVEVRPKTGRTHQIRVHFQAIHHPVVCDKLYATTKPSLLGFDRLALHARGITFKTVSGEKMTLTAFYPDDFSRAIDMIGYNVLD